MAIALTHCVQEDVAKVFYKVLQGGVIVQSWIAPDDKDFISQFDRMCLASTVWIFKFHERYGKEGGKFNSFQLGMIKDGIEDLREEWLDSVFGANAKLDMEVWSEQVLLKENSWIFDSAEIRQKLIEKAGLQNLYKV